MSNLALEQAIGKLGAGFVRAKVGDRYVLETLQQKKWTLGGENSGHIILLEKHTTGDGIVAALQVLTALREGRGTLAKLAGQLQLYPQVLINVKVERGFDWENSLAIQQAQKTAEKALGASGRVLLRASGTEAVLRVMVEGRDGDKVDRVARRLADVVAQCAAG